MEENGSISAALAPTLRAARLHVPLGKRGSFFENIRTYYRLAASAHTALVAVTGACLIPFLHRGGIFLRTQGRFKSILL